MKIKINVMLITLISISVNASQSKLRRIQSAPAIYKTDLLQQDSKHKNENAREKEKEFIVTIHFLFNRAVGNSVSGKFKGTDSIASLIPFVHQNLLSSEQSAKYFFVTRQESVGYTVSIEDSEKIQDVPSQDMSSNKRELIIGGYAESDTEDDL